MKKLLLLGGSTQQVVAIKKAKELGFYTVLCDYLPDNPGRHEADKFYLVSTTDREAVLEAARNEKIDGVLAYASDPAAPTAAYVAEKLDLPGNPYESVNILTRKDLFRQFLQSHGFCTPKARGYDNVSDAVDDIRAGVFKMPVIVKPVDSSGSKGVSKISDTQNARVQIENAMLFSHCGRVIVEEFVEKYGYQIAGDGLSVDGRLVFRYFANDHFDTGSNNPFVPISASFPYNMPEEVQEKIHDTIQRLITLLGMRTCTYNFDMRIDDKYNVYLMEVAPRDGGNYIPDVIRRATGVDLVECAVRGAMGEKVEIPDGVKGEGYWSYYAVHSRRAGTLSEIAITDEGRAHIVEDHIIRRPGDRVEPFTGANTTLGCFVMRFDSMEEMLDMMDNSEKWIEVRLQEREET